MLTIVKDHIPNEQEHLRDWKQSTGSGRERIHNQINHNGLQTAFSDRIDEMPHYDVSPQDVTFIFRFSYNPYDLDSGRELVNTIKWNVLKQ